MASVSKYQSIPLSNTASAREVVLSMMRDNFVVEDSNQVQPRLKILNRKKNEDKIDKLSDKIDKAIGDFKKEAKAIQTQFDLEILARRESETKNAQKIVEQKDQVLEQMQKYLVELEGLKLELGEKVKYLESKLSDKMECIGQDLKIEKEGFIQSVDEEMEGDLNHMFCNWLWTWVCVRVNGFDVEGVLTQVACDHLIIINSSHIFVIPVKRVDFVGRCVQPEHTPSP